MWIIATVSFTLSPLNNVMCLVGINLQYHVWRLFYTRSARVNIEVSAENTRPENVGTHSSITYKPYYVNEKHRNVIKEPHVFMQ